MMQIIKVMDEGVGNRRWVLLDGSKVMREVVLVIDERLREWVKDDPRVTSAADLILELLQ